MKTFVASVVRAATRRLSTWSPAVLAAATFAAVLWAGASVQAGTFNWIGSSDNNYTNPAAWDMGTVPGILDTANIGNATLANATVLYTNVLSDPLSTNKLSLLQMNNAVGTSVFNMTDGVLLITNASGTALSLGTVNGAVDTFTQSGGTLVVARPSSGNLYYQDGFQVGGTGGATGTFSISGGLAAALCGVELSGGGTGSAGAFTVSGGTFIDNGWFGVGRGNNGNGTFNLSGGAMYILRNPNNDGTGNAGGVSLSQGTNAISTANISGGTLYCTMIRFNTSLGSTETLNVSGGNLNIGYLGLYRQGAAASQPITISGGTFHSADMLRVAAGSTIGDTNTVLSDGTNWAWDVNLPVNLTNSTFLVNGVSGPGYVTFAPEATRTITLNNVWSGVGGLTVNGPGTVAMSGANTYTGGTTISQGTLAFNTGAAVADGTLTVAGGATLDFNAGNVTQTFTNNVSGAGNLLVTLGGSGTEVTTGNLGHSGSTLVRSGALEVDGALNNSSSVVVTNGAKLGGGGAIGVPISLRGNAVLYTGTAGAPGTLTAGDVSLSDNATLTVRIGTATTPGGGTNDLLTAHNLTLAPGSALNINAIAPISIGTYVLARCSGTLTGTFGTVNGPGGASVTYTGNEVDLVVTSTNIANLTWNALIGATNIAWDISTSSNWINSDTLLPATFHQSDAVTFNSKSGTTNRVSVTGAVSPSSVAISGGLPYLFSGLGHISGGTGITYNDTNTSGIYTVGNDYTGPVHINAGALQLGNGGSSWLGATNGATYVNGGTLDLNGQNVGSEPLVLQGAGAGGTNGAINNTSGSSPSLSGGPLNITLAGDTTINASGARWDIGVNSLGAGGGSFQGNGYALTKIGPNEIWLHEVGDIGVGNIFVNQSRLGFQYTIGLGDPSKTITVASGASIGIWQAVNVLSKQVVLANGANIYSYSGGTGTSNVLDGTITLYGVNSFNSTGYRLDLRGPIVGTGGFEKDGTSVLYVQGTNTYTGVTFISAGGIVLGPNAVFGPSSPIDVASGAFLDATAVGGLTLASGQTLSDSGGVAGDVTVGAGSTIAPGTISAAGTLTFSNKLTLNGGTSVIKLGNDPSTVGGGVNDLVSVANNLTFSGTSTIEITPIGTLDTNSAYTIMQYSGTLTGGAANIHVVCDNPGYTVTLVDPTTTPASIQVKVIGSPANLLWQGTAAANPNVWDHTITNWLNLNTASPAAYHPGDNTIFDDTASTKTVDVTATNIGSMTTSNTADYTFIGGGPLGGTLDLEGTGTTTLAVSNPPAFNAIIANSGTLAFDVQGVGAYSNNATISDNGSGQATVVKAGTNTLVLGADNSSFNGTIVVNNGVLRYTNSASLGATAGYLYATNTGTLDLNGVSSGPKNINVAGAGFNGQGAVVNSGGALVNQAGIYYLNFVGDATLGGSGRWDIYNNIFLGNGFNLTKIGISALFFSGDLETGLGNIDIQNGRIGFQADITMGDPTKTVTIHQNAALTFYGLTNSSSPNGGVDKIAIMQGNSDPTNGFAVMDSGLVNNFNGPVTLVGTNIIFGVRNDLYLWNSVSGSGGFIVSGDYYAGSDHFSGNGTLYLEGTNTYTGPTIISNNAVVVGTNSSLGASSLIQVNGGTLLNVSAPASFNLGGGQTLIGAGTVVGGNIVFGSGATLAAGFPDANTYTLTMNGSLTLQPGSTNVVIVNNGANDKVSGLTSVQMGGTLVVNNLGSPLASGQTIPLFSASSYSGSFDAIVPATPGAGLIWNTNTLDSDGTLRVASATGINPTPTNIVFSVSAGQLTLSWPGDHTGWTLQAQTNSLSGGLRTNWVDVPGSTVTNKIIMSVDSANGTVFYRMILTNP